MFHIGKRSRALCPVGQNVCSLLKSTGLILLLAHVLASAGLAGDAVVAHLRNGRSMTGVVDEQTTPRRLWLRLTAPDIVAHSSVDWRDVARIRTQGRDYSAEEFLPQALRQKSKVPDNFFRKPAAAAGAAADEGRRDRAAEKKAAPRVQSLQIEASLANFDSSAVVDGFEVHVSPLATGRDVVPVSGVLTVELIGQNLTPDLMFEPVGEKYSRLERWSVRLARSDFDGREAVVRLPFRSMHPEFDIDVRYYGQLDASLNVDGQGVYDATVPVVLRTYSPLRERMQQYDRYRFFAGERTGNYSRQHVGIFPGDVTGR